MQPLFHRGGPFPCGDVAIFVHAMPNAYEITADNVRLLNGVIPKRGDPMLCGSCGKPVVPMWLYPSPDAIVSVL